MKKVRVFALFRIPVSYINPLLEKFAQEPDIDLQVCFCVKPPDDSIFPKNLNYRFLEGAEDAYKDNEHSERDSKIWQTSVVKEIRDFLPDVLFIGTGYLMPTTWIAISTARKLRIPIITRMTTEAVEPNNFLKKLAKRLVVGTYCSKMKAGVYECAVQKNYMTKYGMKEQQLHFAPCAVDNEYFSELAKKYTKSEAKKRLGVDEDCIVIVDTAELIERKRPMDLILAVESLSAHYKIKTFFIGKGVLYDQLKLYSEEKGIDECVLCGRLSHEEMTLYLCAADIFVMPSENDASPKALNEAMNFSVAIVITDGICTAQELCKDGENGFVYHAGNVVELVKKLSMVMDSKEKTERYGLESKRIITDFSYENVIKGWKEAVYSCVN